MYKEEPRWVISPSDKNTNVPFLKAIPLRTLENQKVQFSADTINGKITLVANLRDTFQMSGGQVYDDMCEMNILNEPEVLRNLVERYKKDQIFTYIGPTLIVINPYRVIERLFNAKVLAEMRQNILSGNLKTSTPHIYMVAGKAYHSMLYSDEKQAIIISGESGAGKTQSTKYCMQIITNLSHKQTHSIQKKILACNPLLEAFGNSKTVRNDNSSRFGKYVQIFFGDDNTIKGANIISYLLQKSRVVSVAANERSFHAFYALTASKSYETKGPENYIYLKQSGCYTATNIDDSAYFKQINKSMDDIGFSKQQQQKIWKLLYCILNLGNLQFEDKKHQINEDSPCQIIGKQMLGKIGGILGIDAGQLERILLFEKKIMLKQVSLKPYNKAGCISNRNTFSKAIYNSIFQFILYKIEISLKPSQQQKFKSLNLLDIFGFQNFKQNSLQQICINFTNQKLLKQYNRYIFENQMQILKQDGLEKQISSIKPPTNDDIIATLSGQLSIFSIINDNTNANQFKDADIIGGFRRDFKNSKIIKFDLIKQNQFTVVHSQCEVSYNIEGFKLKNQDKVNSEIEQVYKKLFHNQNKNQVGKTLLNKFAIQIEDLVKQLGSATNHFVRCIKPNEQKKQNYAQELYMLTQIRYLGVFETIQIRQKTFPARKLYEDFSKTYLPVFSQKIKAKQPKEVSRLIMKQVKTKQQDYLFGNRRIYMSKAIQQKLNQEMYRYLKVKTQKAKVLQKFFKKIVFRKKITRGLKLFVKRKNIWRKFAQKSYIKIIQDAKQKISKYAEFKRKQAQQARQKAMLKIREEQQKEKAKALMQKNTKLKSQLPKVENSILKIYRKSKIFEGFQSILKFSYENKKPKNSNQNVSIRQLMGTNIKNEEELNETMIDDSNSQTPYKLQPINKITNNEIKEGAFDQSFTEGKSIFVSNSPDVLFQKTISIGMFDQEEGDIQKLQKILAEQYKLEISGNQQEFFSPSSADCTFKIEDTPQQIFNKILHFKADDFFKKVLRKRTTFLGMQKNYVDVLVAKPRALNKTLTLISESDEDKALKVFKVIVRIGEEAKLDNVFKLIENMISLCQSTTQQLKNEVFLQLIKQSNTSHELASIRIFQSIAVFLHIYTPDNEFIMAGLFILFQRLSGEKHSEKEEQYLRYLFKKMIRKIQNPPVIGYMPIKYQMMALMCKRQISIPVYLPVGNSILIRVESYDTFADIKARVIEQFGINQSRIHSEMFRFFEIVNFENEQLEESPINENQIVWDIMTYWELAKQKYREANSPPPAFFLMLKIVYAFEIHPDDIEGIQLCFAQCYFDYFIGRIKLDFDHMAGLAGCVKKIKLANRPENEILGSYPIWMAKKYQKEQLAAAMIENVKQMQSQQLDILGMKYRFLEICNESPLAMSMAIPTDQPIKLFFKPKKIYLAQKCEVIQEYSMRSIVRWSIDKQKFVFDVKTNVTHAIFTEYAHICSQFLYDLPKIGKKGH